jgi:hypothetical protein
MKKFILFVVIIFSFLIVAQNCLAVDLLLKWPEIGPDKETLGEQSDVPGLISYIYKFALGICGVVALISIVFGAAQYAFSAGNSSKAEDAKDRITQALLGIVILLFSYLILYTINPDLVNLKLNSNEGGDKTEELGWACYYCHYPTTYPDPSMYCDKNTYPDRYDVKKFCRTNITSSTQADTECKNAKTGTEFFYLIKQESCN